MKDDVKNEYGRCIECGCKDTHNLLCSLIDADQAKEEIKTLVSKYNSDMDYYERKRRDNENFIVKLRKQITYWSARFSVVKNENNKLRQKLYEYRRANKRDSGQH